MNYSVRKEVNDVQAYVPGKSIEEVKEKYGIESVIKLNSNENPYGPYKAALNVMIQEVRRMNIYPEKNFIKLKNILGDKYGLTEDNIGIGHGAGGIIETVAKTFLEEGDEVIVPTESYRLYREVSKIMGAKVIEVPLDDSYTIDLDKINKAITDKTKLIWICNPNNPTATMVDKKKLESLIYSLPEKTWIVLDEAYYEFADEDKRIDGIKYIKEGKNLMCIRTFSKYYGLAGGRIGYLIADSEIIQYYDRVSEPFNANRTGLAGAVATIELCQNDYIKYGEIIIKDREILNSELKKLGCETHKSYANFIFFSTEYEADDIAEQLLNKGIIVRSCSEWGYSKSIRVTIGTKEENNKFFKSLKEILKNKEEEKIMKSETMGS